MRIFVLIQTSGFERNIMSTSFSLSTPHPFLYNLTRANLFHIFLSQYMIKVKDFQGRFFVRTFFSITSLLLTPIYIYSTSYHHCIQSSKKDLISPMSQ